MLDNVSKVLTIFSKLMHMLSTRQQVMLSLSLRHSWRTDE